MTAELEEKIRILIVDDHPENLFSLEAILEEDFLEIIPATSGKQALALCELYDFALIFSDVQMPEMDGFHFLELLRADEKNKLVPVIFVTAINKDEKYVNKGYEEGAVDYLFKPLNPTIVKSKADIFVKLYREKLAYQSEKLKESEGQKDKLARELQKRNEEVMRFNYVVSHNLKAPLANLLGLSNVLRIPNLSEEEKMKMIEHIQNASNKMNDLVNDLGYTLAGSKPLGISKEWVQFDELMEGVKNTLQQPIEAAQAQIELHLAADAQTLYCVAAYLETIMFNLISNSIKYRADDRVPVIQVITTNIDDSFCIVVKDNGKGIDLDRYGEHVFGLYKRFHIGAEGRGLGLFLTKMQVESLGGSISVESKVNEGACFTIHLPLEE
ncbi:MAG: sensor histidine kinase [Bacteroidia bacterium]